MKACGTHFVTEIQASPWENYFGGQRGAEKIIWKFQRSIIQPQLLYMKHVT